VLSTWPDGSIKWVLVDFLADIPRQGQVDAVLVVGADAAERPLPERCLVVRSSGGALHVDNGVLGFDVRHSGFRLLENLRFGGVTLLHGIDGLARKAGQVTEANASRFPLQCLTVEELGPLKAVLYARGCLATGSEPDSGLLDFTARLTVAAGAPWVRVEWCLVNRGNDLTSLPDPRRLRHGRILAGSLHDRAFTPVDRMRLDFDVALPGCDTALLGGDMIHTFHYEVHPPARYIVPFRQGNPTLWQSPGRGGCRAWACGHGPQGQDWIDLKDETAPYAIAPRPIHRRFDDGSETIELLAPLAGWVHMTNGLHGFTVQLLHFYENRPKAIHLDTDRIALDLWPEEEGVLRYEEGVSKTHVLTVSLFDTGMRSGHVDTVAAARARPVVVRLDPLYVQSTGAAGDIFPEMPERYPIMESAFRIGSRATRRSGQGMMNWGDEGSDTFMNNQYDWQFACLLYFLRTGAESAFIDGEACTWHSMDVDTIHHHRDPLMCGGQHDGRDEHTALPVDPHMLFCQGMLLYYHLTGHPRARDLACGIARHAIRQLQHGASVFNNGRTAGWSLLCLAAAYEETRAPDLRDGIEAYCERLEEWQTPEGAFPRRVADGHNGYWHGSNAFYSGILLSAVYRTYQATGSERAKAIFLKGVNHLVNQMTRPHGVIGMSEGPPGENASCVATSYSIHGQTQALAWASRMTKDLRYVRQAVRFWELSLKFGGIQQLGDIRMAWWAIFRFLQVAHDFQLLDDVERRL
jgi:hypothetical protein